MPQFKRLKSDIPYVPLAGWNPDGNGTQLRPEESPHVKNLRFFQKDTVTRGGTSVLAYNTPSADPILHVHNYKAPDGKEKLFGFTKSGIYLYNPTTKYWIEAWSAGGSYELGTESTTNWTSSFVYPDGYRSSGLPVRLSTTGLSPVVGSAYLAIDTDYLAYFGTKAGETFPTLYTEIVEFLYTFPTVVDLRTCVSGTYYTSLYLPSTTFVEAPFSFETAIEFLDAGSNVLLRYVTDTYTYNTEAEFLSAAVNTLGAWKKNTLPSSVFSTLSAVKYARFSCKVLTGAINVSGLPIPQSVYTIDYIKFTAAMLSSNVSFWHTTDFIDNTQGATIVACGSNPPQPGGEENDEASRTFLYYNTSEGVFKPLEQKHQMITVDESSGKKLTDTTTTITSTASLVNITGGAELVPGTFYLYTAEKGIIARSSTIEGTFSGHAGYALVPVDTLAVAGLDSYVLKDGTAWSLKINGTAQVKDLNIFIGYDYKEISTYKPRFVWILNNRLIMANTYEDSMYQPWRVRWTALADIVTVKDVDYIDLIDTDVTPIVGGDYQASNLIIYKTGCIVKGRYVGDPYVYTFDTVFKSGTFAGRTVCSYNHKQYFLGHDDVCIWDGSVASSITIDPQRGNYRVRERIFSVLNNAKVHYCMANIYPKYQEYWLWIVRENEDYPSCVFVYNMVRGVWSYFEFAATTCVGLYNKRVETAIAGQVSYDELVGSYNEQNWAFEGGYLDTTVQSPILAYEAGNVYIIDETLVSDGSYTDDNGNFVSGTPIPVEFITRDFTLGDISYQKRFLRLNFEAVGQSVSVGCSPIQELDVAAFQDKDTVALDATSEERHYFPDLVNETIRFCFEASGYFSLRWLQPQGIELDYENE